MAQIGTMPKQSFGKRLVKDLKKNRVIYILGFLCLSYYIIFCYLPLGGVMIAFKNFRPARGIFGSAWADPWYKYFEQFFGGYYFGRLLRNTLLLSVYDLIFGFPAPILLALLLNELRSNKFKRMVQTASYLPHFISTVVICGIILDFFSGDGLINQIAMALGGEKTLFMQDPKYFRTIYVASGIWQGIGWGSIIYLSAIAGIDASLYEAAVIDGANKFQQIINITIPSIMSTIIIMFILQIGQMMNVGSEKIMLLYNPSIYETSDVISTYVYRIGLVQMNWSFSAAVDLFNKVINFILLITANDISKRVSEVSLM